MIMNEIQVFPSIMYSSTDGVASLLVEGGGKLGASLLHEGLVDRILWTRSAHLIGSDGIPAIGMLAIGDLPDEPTFQVIGEGRFGRDEFIRRERTADIR